MFFQLNNILIFYKIFLLVLKNTSLNFNIVYTKDFIRYLY